MALDGAGPDELPLTGEGQLHGLVVANRSGHVLLERWFDPPAARSPELRAQLLEASASTLAGGREDEEHAAVYRGRHIAWTFVGAAVLYAVGSGEFDSLGLAEVLRAAAAAVRAVTKSASPAEPALVASHGKLCLALDELAAGGSLGPLDAATIRKGLKMWD